MTDDLWQPGLEEWVQAFVEILAEDAPLVFALLALLLAVAVCAFSRRG